MLSKNISFSLNVYWLCCFWEIICIYIITFQNGARWLAEDCVSVTRWKYGKLTPSPTSFWIVRRIYALKTMKKKLYFWNFNWWILQTFLNFTKLERWEHSPLAFILTWLFLVFPKFYIYFNNLKELLRKFHMWFHVWKTYGNMGLIFFTNDIFISHTKE